MSWTVTAEEAAPVQQELLTETEAPDVKRRYEREVRKMPMRKQWAIKKEIADALKINPEDIQDLEYEEGDDEGTFNTISEEYKIYRDEDVVTELAERACIEDVEGNPDVYGEFLQGYIDRDKLRDHVRDGLEDSERDYVWESQRDEAEENAADALDIDKDDVPEARQKEFEGEVESQLEILLEQRVDKILQDPEQHMEDIYGKDWAAEVPSYCIDYEEAGKAIAADKDWIDSIPSYDQTYETTKSGLLVVRES